MVHTPELIDDDSQVQRSLYECLSDRMRKIIDELPKEIMDLGPEVLEERAQPTLVLRKLRSKLWKEYERTLKEEKSKIAMLDVCKNICTRQYFYEYVVGEPVMLAWFIHPQMDFDQAAEEALDFGLERLRSEILTAPLYKTKADGSRGEFLKDNAHLVLSAVKYLDARVKGSPLQRIEQKNLHLHANAPPRSVSRESLLTELEQIRAQLALGSVPQLNVPGKPDVEPE